MLRITLSSDQRAAAQVARRDPTLTPLERDRVEMVLLSAAGWSPPAIAHQLDYHAATVRTALKAFAARGLPGLWHQRPGPPPDVVRREQVTTALDRLLGQPRTWTAAQLAHALRAEGIQLSTRQTRRYLQGMGAKWRRTVRSLRHKQDSVKVERAKHVLAMLGKGRPRGSSSASTSMSAASAPVSPSR
jgi:putative transposase